MKNRKSTSLTFSLIILAHLLFLVRQTTLSFPQSRLKPFIRPADIEKAKESFADKYVYIDKTEYFSELFNNYAFGQTYFFVRPRRFGKSTFLQTLHRIFDGSKDIFKGTYIHGTNHSWEAYPVLYLDLGRTKEKDCSKVMLSRETRLVTEIRKQLEKFITSHKLSYKLNESHDVVDEFVVILNIVNQEKGKPTVVLVDEYDLPVQSNMKDCPAAEKINRDHLEDLFQALKTEAGLIKFAFVTGISRSVFRSFISPPDVKDISERALFHGIAGITDYDLNTTYAEHIADIAKRQNETNVTGILKYWYDGYQFASDNVSHLYTPLSVHGYFENNGVAKPYYDDKAHAEFIFEQMMKRPDDFSNLDLDGPVSSDLRAGRSLDHTEPAVLLYDAGYLTIQSHKNGQYFLGFPNKEMELAFYKDCADAAWCAEHSISPEIRLIGDSLKKKDPDVHTFMKAVNSALMKLKIRPKYEQWYQHETRNFMDQAKIQYTNVETFIKTMNFGDHRVDITGYDKHTCYLFEVKRDESFWVAWEQTNKTIETFLNNNVLCPENKNLLAAGITFSSDVGTDVLIAYQAKLFGPNGEVLGRYQSEQFAKSGSVLRQYMSRKGRKKDFSFSHDDLFVKSRE